MQLGQNQLVLFPPPDLALLQCLLTCERCLEVSWTFLSFLPSLPLIPSRQSIRIQPQIPIPKPLCFLMGLPPGPLLDLSHPPGPLESTLQTPDGKILYRFPLMHLPLTLRDLLLAQNTSKHSHYSQDEIPCPWHGLQGLAQVGTSPTYHLPSSLVILPLFWGSATLIGLIS